MTETPDSRKNRAFFWTLIIGAVLIFAIRDSFFIIRLIGVGVFALVLKMLFNTLYDYFTANHGADDEPRETDDQKNDGRRTP
jgi:1,4-dihydroxy-2-naphthoate octaprenyltransferase